MTLEQGQEQPPIGVREAGEYREMLVETRRDLEAQVAQFATFKSQVRQDVIKHVKAGTICRPGANEQLEDWGLAPWNPRYVARFSLEVMLEGIETDDSDDVRYNVGDYFSISADRRDHELTVVHTSVDSIDEEDS